MGAIFWNCATGAVFGLLIGGSAAAQVTQTPEPYMPPPVAPAEEAPPAGPAIVMENLSAIDPAALGTLYPQNGGLPENFWDGTGRDQAERLIAGLPVASKSPVVQDMVRRLLLSAVRPPAGPTRQPGRLLGLRAAKLLETGDLALLRVFLDFIGPGVQDATLNSVRADAAFLAGDDQGACAAAEAGVAQAETAALRRDVAYCRALAGNLDGAQLSIDLMSDLPKSDQDQDANFASLMPAVMGQKGKPKPVSWGAVTALDYAMLRHLDRKIPPAGIADLPLAVQMAVRNADGDLDPMVSLAIAERAAAYGALTVQDLQQHYTDIALEPGEEIKALTPPKGYSGLRRRAALYQLARDTAEPVRRTQYIRAALDAGRAAGLWSLTARVMGDLAAQVEPDPALAAAAPDLSRALLLAGQENRAIEWSQMLRDMAADDPRLQPAANKLGALFAGFDPVALGRQVSQTEIGAYLSGFITPENAGHLGAMSMDPALLGQAAALARETAILAGQ